MFQRKTKLIYWVIVFAFLASVFSGLATGFVSAAAAPATGGGTTTEKVTAGGVPYSDATLVIVSVQISSLNGAAVGANTFAGDTIVQTGSDFYIDGSSGNQITQIPSAINLAIYDVQTGVQLGTYCSEGTATVTTLLPCGSDYIIPGDSNGNLTITPGGVIYYQGLFSASIDDPPTTIEVAAGKGLVTENAPQNFVACPSGPNITLSSSCNSGSTAKLTADEANWTVSDQTANTTSDSLTHTGMSLPLTDYTVPADLATSAITPTDASSSNTPSCDNSGFSLSWIMCPLIDAMAKAVDGIYVDLIEPLLATPPIVIDQPADCLTTPPPNPTPTGCDSTHTYEIWTEFRNYGNIFLVLALLGLVFGEIIGGGIIQAYTAKKMLPRILLAVILINLSIYIIAALLDITNVIGSGLADLISTPFTAAAAFHITLNGTSTGIGLFAFVGAAGAGIWALALAPELIMMFLLFMLLPALLAMLAVLFTVVIRQGLIIFLVISSPVAFALYVLPNTEQYFKKWWHLLFTTLLVYPIIAVIFAMANALSVTLSNTATGQNGGLATISQLVAMVAIIMPLFLVPFAFKIAGGVMGSIYGGLSGLGKKAASGIQGDPRNENSFQNKLRNRFREIGAKRGNTLRNYLSGKTTAPTVGEDGVAKPGSYGKFRRGLANSALKRLPDYDRRVADSNRKWKESIGGKLAAGSDTLERAFFAKEATKDMAYTDANGQPQKLQKGHFYSTIRGSDGKYKEHAAGDVAKAHSMYDGNASKIQYLMEYEAGKMSGDEEFYGVDKDNNVIYDPSRANEIDRTRMPGGSFMSNLPGTLKGAKLGSTPASGAAIGTFFATANQRRELKHVKMKDDLSGWKPRDDAAFVNEHAEVMSAYATANSKPSEIKALTGVYQKLEQKRVAATKGGPRLSSTEVRAYKQLQQIAPSYDERLRNNMMQQRVIDGEVIATADQTVVSVGEDGTPVTSGALAGSGAPVMTAQAMQELVNYHHSLGTVNIDQEYPEYKRASPPPPPSSPGPSSSPPRPSSGPSRPSSSGSSGEIDIEHEGVTSGSPRNSNSPRWSPDITDIDSTGRPHNEKGEFISYGEADVAEGNAETIRDGLPGRNGVENVVPPPPDEQSEDK